LPTSAPGDVETSTQEADRVLSAVDAAGVAVHLGATAALGLDPPPAAVRIPAAPPPPAR
jgi:hypothetical protein